METPSGAIINSNLTDNLLGGETPMGIALSAIKIGQIVEVLYVDNPRNIYKTAVEYDVLVNEDFQCKMLYKNCRTQDALGDERNFSEIVLTPTTEGQRGDKGLAEIYEYKNGAMVVIGFISDFKTSGIILCGFQHPAIKHSSQQISIPAVDSNSSSIDDRLKELPTLTSGSKSPPTQSQSASSTGATENDGQRILGEFNGVRWNINPLGELTIIFQGLKNTKGNLQNSAAQPTIIKINKDGEFFIIDNLDQEIKVSRKDEAITITDGKTDPNIITIDRKNDHITVKSVKTVQLVAPVVDLLANTSIINGTAVKLGGKDASEHVVLGNQFMKLYNALVSAFLSHTHFVAAAPGVSSSTTSTADDMTAPKHLSQNVLVDKIFSGKPDLS